MTFVADMRALAEELIGEFGKAIVYRIPSAAINADSGIATVTGHADTAIRGVVRLYDRREVDGTTIQAGDVEVMVATKDLDEALVSPRKGDLIVDGSEVGSIVAFQKINAGGDGDAVHAFQVRF